MVDRKVFAFISFLLFSTTTFAQSPYSTADDGTGSGAPTSDQQTAAANAGLVTCDSVSLDEVASTDYCVDVKGRISKITNSKDINRLLPTGRRIVIKTHPLNTKELYAAGFIANSTTSKAVARNGAGGANGGAGAGPSGNSGFAQNGGGNVGSGNARGSAGGSTRSGRGGGSGKSAGVQAEADLSSLNDFCESLPDMISDRQDSIDDLNKQLKELTASLDDAKKDYKDAETAMFKKCRKQCINLAAKSADKSDCSQLSTPEDVIGQLGSSDLNNPDVIKLIGSQNQYNATVNANTDVDPTGVCSTVIGSIKVEATRSPRGCVKAIIDNEGITGCAASADWLDAYNAYKDKVTQLASIKAKLDTMASNTNSGCKVSNAKSVASDKWNSCSTKCLETALDSCAQVLADADANAKVAQRGSYCATCSTGQQGGSSGSGSTCQYGGCVSHAAQIVSAAGSALSALTPLGLGVMNSINYSNGLNTCTKNYAAELNVYTNVGIAPPSSNCGITSAMSGFSSGTGYGSSAYSQYGIPGISTGSYPYGVSGATSYNGAYSPYTSQLGLGGYYGSSASSLYGSTASTTSQYADSIQRQQMLGLQTGAVANGQYTNYGLNSGTMSAYSAYNPYAYSGLSAYGSTASAYSGASAYAPSAYYNPYYSGYGTSAGVSAGFNLGTSYNSGYNAYSPTYNSYTPYIPYNTSTYTPTTCTVGTNC